MCAWNGVVSVANKVSNKTKCAFSFSNEPNKTNKTNNQNKQNKQQQQQQQQHVQKKIFETTSKDDSSCRIIDRCARVTLLKSDAGAVLWRCVRQHSPLEHLIELAPARLVNIGACSIVLLNVFLNCCFDLNEDELTRASCVCSVQRVCLLLDRVARCRGRLAHLCAAQCDSRLALRRRSGRRQRRHRSQCCASITG